MNDKLMQDIIKNKDLYEEKYTNAFLSSNFIIPGISGKKVNIDKSYLKMKSLNSFNPSLLVFDKIKPSISIKNHYDKIILSGNQNIHNISLVINVDNQELFTLISKILQNNNVNANLLTSKKYSQDDTIFVNNLSTTYQDNTNYCLTFNQSIDKNCVYNHLYTVYGHNINNYHLTKTKEILHNGIIIVYTFNHSNYHNLNIIIKYLKNNNYQIVSIDKLINE